MILGLVLIFFRHPGKDIRTYHRACQRVRMTLAEDKLPLNKTAEVERIRKDLRIVVEGEVDMLQMM